MALRSLLDPLFSKKFFRLGSVANTALELNAPAIDFTYPSSQESLPIFWATTNLREPFQKWVMLLIDELEAWGKKHDLLTPEIENNLTIFREQFKRPKPNPADFFPLYTTGIKELANINHLLENGQASLAVKTHIVRCLLLDLDKCGPGALNPIINTALSLRTDIPSQLIQIRTTLAHTIAIDAIRLHQSFILEQMPGEEIHWVNWLLNLYHADLGILYIADSRATDRAFADLSAEIKQTFQEQIANTMSVSWLMEQIIEQSSTWQYLSQMDPNKLTPDDLTNFNAWLNSYGPQPTFYLTDLIEEKEDYTQCWHPERVAILKHQLLRRFILAGFVRNREKRYAWEEHGKTITFCLPYSNNLELAYVLAQGMEIPLIVYSSGQTEKERIANIVNLASPIIPGLKNVMNFLNADNITTLNMLTSQMEYLPGIDRLLTRFPRLTRPIIETLFQNISAAYPWIEILLDDGLSITAKDAYLKLSNINWDMHYLPDFFSLISVIQTLAPEEKKKYFGLAYERIDESSDLLEVILHFFKHHSKDNVAHYLLATKLLKVLLDQRLNISDISHLLNSTAKLMLLFDLMNCPFKIESNTGTLTHHSFFTLLSEEEMIARRIQKHLIENKDGTIDFLCFSEAARKHMESAIRQFEAIFGDAVHMEPKQLAASSV